MPAPSSTVTVFRAQWATRFVDTVTITRTTARGTFNTGTGQYGSGTAATPYTGEALIRPLSRDGVTAIFGEQEVTGKLYAVTLPWDAVADVFQPEDIVTVDASLLDLELVGQVMRVLSDEHDSYKTRRRIVCRLDEGAGYAD